MLCPTVQAGWNQLKLDQSSCSVHDKIGIVWLAALLALDFNKGGCVKQI